MGRSTNGAGLISRVLFVSLMARAAEELNRAARTVIEAADPAVQPVAKLRRFVVKRIEFVGTPLVDDLAKHSGKAAQTLGVGQRRAKSPGLQK
jgi:hypothetical protein